MPAVAKANARTRWMQRFQAHFIALRPDLAGRIDWDTATYLFMQGAAPEPAAESLAAK